jgi:hypothetical protein
MAAFALAFVPLNRMPTPSARHPVEKNAASVVARPASEDMMKIGLVLAV